MTNELKEAIKQDNVAQLKQALDDGKDMNTCYSSGKKTYTLLMLATKIKSFQITKYLAKKSKNIDQICIDKTALMYAVESGDLELVKILVRAGADAKKEIGDWSAIDLAVAYRHTDIKHYFNSIGIYKDYDLKGKDGPYIIDGWVYTVDLNE
ncbi:MAG: ankyrin repeat domain-containing protein, partial [Bacteroidota bacterium]